MLPSPGMPGKAEVFRVLNVARTESSLLAEMLEDEELVRANDGRGLRLGVCCAADARYDAGLNDRLAIFGVCFEGGTFCLGC